MRNNGEGFSLIEVMVSLVILVIGLVGIFNLHVVAKRGSFESFQQTQASYYANDIINRMKLNRGEIARYSGAYSGAPSAAGKECKGSAICNPVELVAWDLYEWRASFVGTAETVGGKNVGGLDTPTGCISVTDNTVTVVMAWRGIRETKIDADSPIIDTSPKCAASTENRRIYSIQTVII